MKQRIVFIALLLAAGLQAKTLYTVECWDDSPIYKTHVAGVDSVFIFNNISANHPTFSTVGDALADWYDLTDPTIYSKGYSSFIYLNDGHCYRVVVGQDTATFVVIDYSQHAIDAFPIDSVLMDCQSTTIVYPEQLSLNYHLPDGSQKTWPYTIGVSYKNQVWDSLEVNWVETIQEDTLRVDGRTSATLGRILTDTYFSYSENLLASVLRGEPLLQEDTTHTYTAVAVAQHLLYYITKRGTTLENEINGPYGDGQLNSKIVHSAPLDVLFESHPSAKADGYLWTIKKGNDVITARGDKDIRYRFDEASEDGPVNYTISLKVVNTQHILCIDSAQMEIDLYSSKLLVPNVFTPNGDGVNDEFRVAYQSICEFHCWVYNRWQHLVYQWDDPAKGWDGTVNGRKVPDSAFIYIIEAKGCDGRKFHLKGTVNMLRGE